MHRQPVVDADAANPHRADDNLRAFSGTLTAPQTIIP